jgi:RNase P/RNase MRP subunit POP5
MKSSHNKVFLSKVTLFYIIVFSCLQVLGSCWSAEAQNQFQTQFRNFEVQESADLSRGRSAVAAAAAAAPPSRSEQKESTTPVPILKQINE